MTVGTFIDDTIASLLKDMVGNLEEKTSTLSFLLSDHGLHYGPYLQSDAGQRERAQPVLYIRPPTGPYREMVIGKKEKWTTPFDVHATMLDVASMGDERFKLEDGKNDQEQNTPGRSLLAPSSKNMITARESCLTTPGVPSRYCAQLEPFAFPAGAHSCRRMPPPPSVFSFYADIRKHRKISWPVCSKMHGGSGKLLQHGQKELLNCRCATEKDPFWSVCTDKKTKDHTEIFMKYCEDSRNVSDLVLKVKVRRKERLVQEYQGRERKVGAQETQGSPPPNIIFLEIDSVSHAAAARHFPLTSAIIKKYEKILLLRSKESADSNTSLSSSCLDGMCAVSYNGTVVVGQNSVPNQLAALTGCSSADPWEGLSRKIIRKKPLEIHAWCPPALEGQNRSEYESLLNIAKQKGYITFFGEEFCTKNSPYTVQGNYFPLDFDYSTEPLFCALAEHYRIQQNLTMAKPAWSISEGSSIHTAPCLGGRSKQTLALEYIEGLWEAYPDIPKFAYLNAIAAHDYSIDPSLQILGAEAYDEHFSAFLSRMLDRIKRLDSKHPRTVIVLRSDHGLQGGLAKLDYSTQIEHATPWNSLVVPEALLSSRRTGGGDIFRHNADKLVTGYDLHRTLQHIITGEQGEKELAEEAEGRGKAYDLLTQRVPKGRTCHQARVPDVLCPCMDERKEMAPRNYVGELFPK